MAGRRSLASEPLKLEFEETVRQFFSNLGFEPVKGGSDFFLHPKDYAKYGLQIDAVAGHEDTLLVIECLTKQKLGKGVGLNDEIWAYEGKKKAVVQAIQEGADYPELKKYTNFAFILVTKNFQIGEGQVANAKKLGIELWDDGVLDYYNELIKAVGKFAKYSLLGELGVKPKITRQFEVPALKIIWEGRTVFAFFANPRDLLTVSYVARRESTRERHYQRIIKPDKIEAIVKYLKEKHGFLPNSIILSIKSKTAFTALTPPEVKGWPEWVEFGWLQFPEEYQSCWIIDGQHRLFSFAHASDERRIPFVAFSDLDLTTQSSFFLTINKTQKPVEKELLWDLNGEMLPEEEEGIISNAVKLIDRTEGVLLNRFHIPFKGPKKKGQLRFSTPCIAIKRQRLAKPFLKTKVKNDLLVEGSPDKTVANIAKHLCAYYEAVKNNVESDLVKDEFIFTDSGTPILIGFYPRILSRVKGIPDEADLLKYVGALAEVLQTDYPSVEDLEALRKQTTSFANQDKLIDLLTIKVAQKLSEPEFAEGIEMWGLREIKLVEFRLGKLLKAVGDARTESHNWVEMLSSAELQKILSHAKETMKKSGGKNPEEYLNIGELSKVFDEDVIYSKFQDMFETKFGFNGKDEFVLALRQISNYRGKFEAHLHTDISPKYKEDEIVRIVTEKINKCIQAAPEEFREEAYTEEGEEEEEEGAEEEEEGAG
jgi:DGQHR domain-containing protein